MTHPWQVAKFLRKPPVGIRRESLVTWRRYTFGSMRAGTILQLTENGGVYLRTLFSKPWHLQHRREGEKKHPAWRWKLRNREAA